MLDRADVVIWIGEELSPWLARPIETLASDADVVTLLEVDATAVLPFRDTEAFGQTGHDHGAKDHDHDHDHSHDAMDPHAWLDPANARAWLDVIAETLSQADPANAETYRANALAGQNEIESAVASAIGTLGDPGAVRYVVFHDAYQYFENRFDLSPSGAVTLSDAVAPGPARIAELQKQLAGSDVNCFLIEEQSANPLADLLSDGMGLKKISIDPMGMKVELGSGHYVALLASLSASFAACK